MEIECLGWRGFEEFWCIFSCLLLSNFVGIKSPKFLSNTFQATKMHEIRLLLIFARKNKFPVVLLV